MKAIVILGGLKIDDATATVELTVVDLPDDFKPHEAKTIRVTAADDLLADIRDFADAHAITLRESKKPS